LSDFSHFLQFLGHLTANETQGSGRNTWTNGA